MVQMFSYYPIAVNCVLWLGASQIFGVFRLTGGDFSLVIEKDPLDGQQFGIHPCGEVQSNS